MSRIARRFSDLRESGRSALVTYLMAGDPDPDASLRLMHAAVAAGADILEVGMPFSDAMADGPVIQEAAERALSGGMSLAGTLDLVRRFRAEDPATPVVLMGYANPIETMGERRFVDAARDAGVDGLIAVDLPPEESADLLPMLRDAGIDPIFLIAPTTTEARMRAVCEAASGFVYYVSLKGVTGAAGLDVETVGRRVEGLRRWTRLPIGVGFGIRDARSAAQVARVADAVVVGSAVVTRVAEHGDDPERAVAAITELLADMRRAMDSEVSAGAGASPTDERESRT